MFLVKRQNDARNRMGMFAEPMDTLLGRFFGDWPEDHGRLEMSVPPIDLTESDEVFAVVAELPGMSEADIELSVMDDVLTISGEKTIEEHPDDKRHHTERRGGKFSREVRFSTPVDAEKITAGFVNGVLTVTLPKSDQAKPRTIKINHE
jgi:HSP20 family protein